MKVHIEYLGVSRLVTQKKAEDLELPDGITFRDLARFLSEAYPKMIGYVIQPGATDLQSPNIFNIDGKRMVRRDQMDDPINDGDKIVLMSMSAGG
ncbi:MAG: MoaD/ThiS family protein [Anaerolineae bacterium]|nr:MoaD/ThiS family protein [Anaerolineae bacterium]